MCGWVGIWRTSGRLPEAERIARARDLMAARGPDDAGLWISGTPDSQVALAHRRLSILDLSPRGHQPMERHGIHTAYNGELYNYARLREELERRGETFHSDSDTEILPVGLRVWGFEGLLQKIDGMFSFALWDSVERKLYAARDRVGEKPLYYAVTQNGFVGGSDIKSVVALLEERPAVDEAVLPLYVYHGFIPAPWTVYRGVRKLPPANALVVSERSGEPSLRTFEYWKLDYTPKRRIRFDDAKEELDELLRESVRERLVADVPVGAFLSGGVDSSAVVSYAAEIQPGIKTFSIGFHHAPHNELPHAAKVARRWGTDHHEEVLEVDVLADLPKILWNHGEPFADSSAVPSHAVARAARRHVTVVLTGDGGDEGFAGYPNARAAWLAGFYKQVLPMAWRRRAGNVFEGLAARDLLPEGGRRLWTLARYGARRVYLEPDLWRDDLRAALLGDDIKRRAVFSPQGWHEYLAARNPGLDEFDRYLALDLQVRLPNDYLTKVDVATMAASLEARTPFLAPRILQFAARLPRSVLMPRGESKGLLKALAAGRVPREVIYRKKAGFALPLGAWMRGPYKETIHDSLLAPAALERGYFRKEAVERLLAEHQSGRVDHSGRIWCLLAWETWCRIFLDQPATAGVAATGEMAEAA